MPDDNIEVKLPKLPEGAIGYRLYITTQSPVFKHLRGPRRWWAILRRKPTMVTAGWEVRNDLVWTDDNA